MIGPWHLQKAHAPLDAANEEVAPEFRLLLLPSQELGGGQTAEMTGLGADHEGKLSKVPWDADGGSHGGGRAEAVSTEEAEAEIGGEGGSVGEVEFPAFARV